MDALCNVWRNTETCNAQPMCTATTTIVPATSSNLRISKINYHPSGASDAEKAAGFSRKDFEFIGLTNVSNESISLYGTELAEGIRFEFDNVTNSQIPTGGTAFLVKDSAAFTMRYGSNHAVLGEYQGSLSNDGEQLTLHADGTVLADFTYNDVDPWPTHADRTGSRRCQRPHTGRGRLWQCWGCRQRWRREQCSGPACRRRVQKLRRAMRILPPVHNLHSYNDVGFIQPQTYIRSHIRSPGWARLHWTRLGAAPPRPGPAYGKVILTHK